MDNYIIVTSNDPLDLVRVVNEQFKKNYRPIGGVSSMNVTPSHAITSEFLFLQAMVLVKMDFQPSIVKPT